MFVMGALDILRQDKMVEFNLSDKILSGKLREEVVGYKLLRTKNVKEFIRLEGNLLNNYFKGKITFNTFLEKRLKLIGDKLI